MTADLTAVQDSNGARYEVPPPPEPRRVDFGTGKTQNIPWEWACWILTAMREAELKGEKPKPFSAWLALCAMQIGAK